MYLDCLATVEQERAQWALSLLIQGRISLVETAKLLRSPIQCVLYWLTSQTYLPKSIADELAKLNTEARCSGSVSSVETTSTLTSG
jgi:hypothetical protein